MSDFATLSNYFKHTRGQTVRIKDGLVVKNATPKNPILVLVAREILNWRTTHDGVLFSVSFVVLAF